MVQQFTIQARPAVRAELIFVRNVCHLNRDELRQISRDADAVLKDVVNKMVDAQLQPRPARNAPGRPAQVNSDAGKLLQEGLAAVMKKHLSTDQWALYSTELAQRQASRKQAGLRYLVESLDRDLYLSDPQRRKLAESLSAHWDDGWSIYLEYVLYGNQFYPMGIDPHLTPILTDVQKKVWQGFQRVGGFWGFGGLQGGFMNDHDGLEEELGETRKVDPRNAEVNRPDLLERMKLEEIRMVQEAELRRVVELRKAAAKAIEERLPGPAAPK
jgi:hypothetical protein